MKRFLIILLFISVAVNIVLKIKKNGRMHHWKEQAILRQYKKVSYKDGHKYFEKKITQKHPEVNLKGKNSIIVFWDSTGFEFMGSETMKDIDSLSGIFGKYSYNYIFSSEMLEDASFYFLKRNDA